MGILNARQFEVLFPIRPLFLEWNGAVADLNPAGQAVSADPGLAHVAEVFAFRHRATAKRLLFDSVEQRFRAP
jgi:hypothetical protein